MSASGGSRTAAWGVGGGGGRAVLVTLAAALGALTGLRAAISISVAGPALLLELPTVPLESLGIDWSDSAVWPFEVQRAALSRLVGTLVGLVLAVASVATLNVATLLAEGATVRRAEIAVRSAVGASPAALARMLLAELRTTLDRKSVV